MSNLLSGAFKILTESPTPLTAQQITDELLERGLWTTSGKTPVATVGAALYTEIKRKGERSRFTKVAKNLFAISKQHTHQGNPVTKRKSIKKGKQQTILIAPVQTETFSYLDSAEKVLKIDALQKPMHYTEITQRAIKYGWLVSNGLTPEASMSAQLYSDIKKCESQGRMSRFAMKKGMVSLTEWSISALERQIDQHNENQRKKLLEKVKTLSPVDFEILITTLLSLMGFSSTERTPLTGDHGVDVRGNLEVHESINIRLAVQAKRWQETVSAPVVRELRGSLRTDERGLIVTTSSFSDGAKKEASRADAHAPIDLINGKQLVDLLVAYNLGVTKNKYQLLEINKSFFDDESVSETKN